MSKRHNRKRTRSRPRHRDAGKAHSNHTRNHSMDTTSSYSTTFSSHPSPYLPSSLALAANESWHPMYYGQYQPYYQQDQGKAHMDAAQRLRLYFGPPKEDEVSLFFENAMLKVVTDLFDGDIDYKDP
ncbi:hypothetical protein B0J11DRAFT_269232 [Dendryphion nanum]|uniref:Uncharacterized protein n=1 Tax=Dendryphion nanum TaxID=256645 RepID=A0A9P9DZZ3_9PLEO|nr:hypothetical protein B0J11DRAFT_269232 [Dendryphion nanum]